MKLSLLFALWTMFGNALDCRYPSCEGDICSLRNKSFSPPVLLGRCCPQRSSVEFGDDKAYCCADTHSCCLFDVPPSASTSWTYLNGGSIGSGITTGVTSFFRFRAALKSNSKSWNKFKICTYNTDDPEKICIPELSMTRLGSCFQPGPVKIPPTKLTVFTSECEEKNEYGSLSLCPVLVPEDCMPWVGRCYTKSDAPTTIPPTTRGPTTGAPTTKAPTRQPSTTPTRRPSTTMPPSTAPTKTIPPTNGPTKDLEFLWFSNPDCSPQPDISMCQCFCCSLETCLPRVGLAPGTRVGLAPGNCQTPHLCDRYTCPSEYSNSLSVGFVEPASDTVHLGESCQPAQVSGFSNISASLQCDTFDGSWLLKYGPSSKNCALYSAKGRGICKTTPIKWIVDGRALMVPSHSVQISNCKRSPEPPSPSSNTNGWVFACIGIGAVLFLIVGFLVYRRKQARQQQSEDQYQLQLEDADQYRAPVVSQT